MKLGSSYEVVSQMRVVPFTLQSVLQLAAATVAPLVPLTFTMFSIEELVTTLFKVVF